MSQGSPGATARRSRGRLWRRASLGVATVALASSLSAAAAHAQTAATPSNTANAPSAANAAEPAPAVPAEWGPFTNGNDFLLAAGFLAAHPGTPVSLPGGAWEVELGYGVANTFAKSQALGGLFTPQHARPTVTTADLDAAAPGRDSVFYIDGEVSRTSVTVRRGLGNGIEIEAILPVQDIGGGYTDGLIEGFHKAFSLNQSGRLTVSRNGYTVYIRNDGERFVRTDGPGAGAGDVVLGAKSELRPPAWLAGIGFGELAVQGLLKLPTGNARDFYGSGSADVGLQLLSTRPLGRGRIDVTLAALVLGADTNLGTSAQTVTAVTVAYERPLFAASSVLAQFDVSQSPLRTVRKTALTPTTYLISFGAGHAFTPRLSAVVGFTENLLNYDNSADIAVHFGLRRRF